MCDASWFQFWMNWGVQVAMAAATFLAVLVALFGEGFRAKFLPPQLQIELADRDGERIPVQIISTRPDGTQQARKEDARYYRVRVSNARRWSTANQVQATLLKVEEPAANGEFSATWVGDVPLVWKHNQIFSVLRSVGADCEADLCSVVKGKWLELHPLITPNNFQKTYRVQDAPIRLVLTVRARSDESDSNVLRVRVSWDGEWEDGSVEMRPHLVIEPAPS